MNFNVSKKDSFVLTALRTGLRVDGRGPQDSRHITTLFGYHTGHCEVSFGKTRALAVVASEIVMPRVDRPNDGFLNVNVELSAMAGLEFLHLSRQSDEHIFLARIIDRILRGSRAIDTEALCILSGKYVWSIRVDVTVLDHDGNLIDACYMAALLALLNFRRPEVTLEGDTLKMYSLEARHPVPLSVHHVPICTTYALFDNGSILVNDPSWEEEQVMTSRVVIAMNAQNEICLLDYPGGMPFALDKVRALPKMAMERVKELSAWVDQVLQGDKKRRERDAMPRYAREFYKSQPPQEGQSNTSTSSVGGTKQSLETILPPTDAFLGFVRRLSQANTVREFEPIHSDSEEFEEQQDEQEEEVEDEEEKVEGVQAATATAAAVVSQKMNQERKLKTTKAEAMTTTSAVVAPKIPKFQNQLFEQKEQKEQDDDESVAEEELTAAAAEKVEVVVTTTAMVEQQSKVLKRKKKGRKDSSKLNQEAEETLMGNSSTPPPALKRKKLAKTSSSL